MTGEELDDTTILYDENEKEVGEVVVVFVVVVVVVVAHSTSSGGGRGCGLRTVEAGVSGSEIRFRGVLRAPSRRPTAGEGLRQVAHTPRALSGVSIAWGGGAGRRPGRWGRRRRR